MTDGKDDGTKSKFRHELDRFLGDPSTQPPLMAALIREHKKSAGDVLGGLLRISGRREPTPGQQAALDDDALTVVEALSALLDLKAEGITAQSVAASSNLHVRIPSRMETTRGLAWVFREKLPSLFNELSRSMEYLSWHREGRS